MIARVSRENSCFLVGVRQDLRVGLSACMWFVQVRDKENVKYNKTTRNTYATKAT
jgi:hypothetical protein